jgi:hypothetical protein
MTSLLLLTYILWCIATIESYSAEKPEPLPLPYDPKEFFTPQVAYTARHGLPKCFDCQNIAVVGAGRRVEKAERLLLFRP